jgi:hypothetical protein
MPTEGQARGRLRWLARLLAPPPHEMSDLSLALGIIVSTVVTGGLAYQSGVATVADDGPVSVAASLALVMGSSGYFGPRCIALTRALCFRRKMAGLSDSIETSERLVAEIESFLDRAAVPSNEAPQARHSGQAPPAIPTVIKAAEQASASLTVLHAALLKLPVPHRAFHAREYEHLRGRLVDQLQRVDPARARQGRTIDYSLARYPEATSTGVTPNGASSQSLGVFKRSLIPSLGSGSLTVLSPFLRTSRPRLPQTHSYSCPGTSLSMPVSVCCFRRYIPTHGLAV